MNSTADSLNYIRYYSVDFQWWFDRFFFSFYIDCSGPKNSFNDKKSKILQFDTQKNCFILSVLLSGLRFGTIIQTNLEAKRMDGSGSSLRKLQNISFYSIFTVNGLNWPQSWRVLICFLEKCLKPLTFFGRSSFWNTLFYKQKYSQFLTNNSWIHKVQWFHLSWVPSMLILAKDLVF